MIGQKLNNRYTITSRLGEGGMGEVYQANDEQTGQAVAIKVLARRLTSHTASLERFRREAETLRQLEHPNIVKFVSAFEHDGQYVIVMEYVPGGSLDDLLRQGLLPVERARQIALDLCDALTRAHRLKIIHRDIKPENVLIDQSGTPKLADFGVARLSEDTGMTRSGAQVGTPYYMAPEAWEGEKLDAQADIWSLGVLLFEMLAGQVPFHGDTPMAVMKKVCTTPPPDLKELRADAPPGLVKIVQRMLARDKSKRYATMREVAVDLEREQEQNIVKTMLDDAEPSAGRVFMPTSTAAMDDMPEASPAVKRGFGGVKRGSAGAKRAPFDPRLLIAVSIIIVVAIFGLLPLMLWFESTRAATATLASALPETVTLTPAIPLSPIASPFPLEITQQNAKMALIPTGTFIMGSDLGEPDEKPVHNVSLDDFYIDTYEVTNELYEVCVEDGGCSPPRDSSKYDNPDYANHPVVFVDWDQATAYCRWRGARLPSEAEWEYAARGTDGRTFPWGEGIDETRANYNQDVNDTTPVGSYEGGKSPFGVYDMAGNVWEWVNDFYDENYYQVSPPSNPQGPTTGQIHILRGGSWNYRASFIRTTFRDRGFHDTNFNDFGFRCAFSAVTLAPILPSNTGQPTTATLTSTPSKTAGPAPTPDAPVAGDVIVSERDGMKLHFVPAGSFLMGSENGGDDEKPIHEVTLDAFWIDETEITNGMYTLCVADGICQLPSNISSFTRARYHDDPKFANYPVIYVSWDNANAYCSWAGRKLPSEAEWEYAARGTDNRTHPWGNQAPNNVLLNFNSDVGDTTEVGTYPSGASPHGALDMAGNVWEWVGDFYDETYYAVSPSSNPAGPDSGETRALRGGSWNNFVEGVRAANRFRFTPGVTDYFVGIRCALSFP